MFGVGTDRARLHANRFVDLLGEDTNSWGLSHKGFLYHSGVHTPYTRPFRENIATTVGILFDGVAGTLTYFKDGVSLGVAFRDLHLVREPLYPIVSSTAAMSEMVLVRTKRDFVNLQDRCRAVITSRVKSSSDLDGLNLPFQLKRYLAESLIRPSKVRVNYYFLDF
ncbi:hypothetical protein AAG570_001881 [Ranatra chinensis]|uniref:SPRY domain-containing SOCS box protein 3 n=1 Tax=Ranatra chinensis TaxID=642074 RepID=A0ABD0Y9S9_9HEMI